MQEVCRRLLMPVQHESISSTVIDTTAAQERDLLQGQTPCLTSTIRKFANAAARAGIDLETLIAILESGVPLQSVLELIQTRRDCEVTPHS